MGLLGSLPSFTELESPKTSLASEVYAREGVLLGKYYDEDRINVEFKDLPKHLINALVATEDKRFYDHSGIDVYGLGRVFVKTLVLSNDAAGGGSTITQQLAKNLFHNKPKNKIGRVFQKFKEWVIAIKLERSYTKDEIVTMYFNTVFFGQNTYGIKTAANTYFGVEPKELQPQESAILVGLLKASTKYNPKSNPENAKKRRNLVFSLMQQSGYLSAAEQEQLSQLPIELRFKPTAHDEGLATYFREHIKQEVKKWAKDNPKLDGSIYDIYKDGLKIYTTLSAPMQQYAEEAVAEHMPTLQKKFYEHWKGKTPWYDLPNAAIEKDNPWYGTNELLYRAVVNSERYEWHKIQQKTEEEIKTIFEKPIRMNLFSWKGEIDTTLSPLDSIKYVKYLLHTGFLALEPDSGHVLAWVGGIDFKHFKYDNVGLHAKRQVGSTFKPLVYTVAVQNGWAPCSKVPNIPVTFPEYDNWSPKNSSHYYEGQLVPLTKGLAYSINWVSAYLMKQITPQPVIDLAKKMGIESKLEPVPSICLGSADISVIEMVGAYDTYANKGFYIKPMVITRIEDKNGNLLQIFPVSKTEVMNERTAYAMLSLMKGVVDGGTAGRLRYKYGINSEVAAKTGTTDDNSDGWFIGCTPQIVAGAWVGGDEKAIRFRSTALGEGASMALPIWAYFMKRVYADSTLHVSEKARFPIPKNIDFDLACTRYDLPTAKNDILEGGVIDSTALDSTGTPKPPVPKPGDANYDYNNQFD